MAKGQMHGNREVKKPKKPKEVVVPTSTFITPSKPASTPPKTK